MRLLQILSFLESGESKSIFLCEQQVACSRKAFASSKCLLEQFVQNGRLMHICNMLLFVKIVGFRKVFPSLHRLRPRCFPAAAQMLPVLHICVISVSLPEMSKICVGAVFFLCGMREKF